MQGSAVQINPDYGNLDDEERAVVDAAIAQWQAVLGNKDMAITIHFDFRDLGGTSEPDFPTPFEVCFVEPVRGPLGVTGDCVEDPITRKPTEATVWLNDNPAIVWWKGIALPPPPGAYDLLSVVKHEIGHAVGFSAQNYSKFAAYVRFQGGQRWYNPGGDPTAILTWGPMPADQQTHFPPVPLDDVMASGLPPGTRKADLDVFSALILNHCVCNPHKADSKFGWTISASNANPDVNIAPLIPGLQTYYLWLKCCEDHSLGMIGAEFGLLSHVPGNVLILAFTPSPGFLNAGSATNLLLATAGCPCGPVVVGEIIAYVIGPDGLCLGPSTGGTKATVDCCTQAPQTIEWVGLGIGGGGCGKGTPCEEGPVAIESGSWGKVKALYR